MIRTGSVCCVTVNFRTPDLVKTCVESWFNYYPKIPHIVVDNGGCQDSIKVLNELSNQGKIAGLVKNPENIYHGPALNQGIGFGWAMGATYAFLLDSDTRVKKGGAVENMIAAFEQDQDLFAIGWLRYVSQAGIAYKTIYPEIYPEAAVKYIHPYACMVDISKLALMPARYTEGGAPAIEIMKKVPDYGWTVSNFPIGEYIWHKEAGTRGLFGGQFRPETNAKIQPYKRRKL